MAYRYFLLSLFCYTSFVSASIVSELAARNIYFAQQVRSAAPQPILAVKSWWHSFLRESGKELAEGFREPMQELADECIDKIRQEAAGAGKDLGQGMFAAVWEHKYISAAVTVVTVCAASYAALRVYRYYKKLKDEHDSLLDAVKDVLATLKNKVVTLGDEPAV